MYQAPTTTEAAQEQASYTRASVQALGHRLEDRGHGDSLESVILLAASAVVDAIRELTFTLAQPGGASDDGKQSP